MGRVAARLGVLQKKLGTSCVVVTAMMMPLMLLLLTSIAAQQLQPQFQCPDGYRPVNVIHCEPASSASSSATTTPPTSQVQQAVGPPSSSSSPILSLHNALRARHQVAPLQWDTTLEQGAAAWARRCKLVPSGLTDRGESLFASGSSDPQQVLQAAVGAWYAGMPDYDYAAARFSQAAGSATQLVWAGTQRLGCAVQQCAGGAMEERLGAGMANLVVCHYAPPGNIIGQFRQNVLRPVP